MDDDPICKLRFKTDYLKHVIEFEGNIRHIPVSTANFKI